MSRDIFKETRLLTAPSNLTWNVSRDGASTTSLGNLYQCLTIPNSKEFLLYIQSKSTLFQFEAITPCPITTGPCKRSLSSLLVAPFKYWKASLRSPRSLFFSRLNSPNSLSFSSQQRCSSPPIIAMASSGPAPTAPCLSCAEGSRGGRRDSRGVLTRAEQRGRIPSPALLATLLGMQPRTWLAHSERNVTVSA